jgi:hypothetical protein
MGSSKQSQQKQFEHLLQFSPYVWTFLNPEGIRVLAKEISTGEEDK